MSAVVAPTISTVSSCRIVGFVVVTSRTFGSAGSSRQGQRLGTCQSLFLEAARGILGGDDANPKKRQQKTPKNSNCQQRPLKCFPLQKHHIGSFSTSSTITAANAGASISQNKQERQRDNANVTETSKISTVLPSEFHETLCNMIRLAKERVYLASLYIGPAADPVQHDKEYELLCALEAAAATSSAQGDSTVDIKILMDHGRALRNVKVKSKTAAPGSIAGLDATTTTTSAEACWRALQKGQQKLWHQKEKPNGKQRARDDCITGGKPQKDNCNNIYLLSVLPSWLQSILPPPINEVFGVFHIKAYIVDDALILTGANLSQEYFTDRIDRYIRIVNGGNGLVNAYADLVKALTKHAENYSPNESSNCNKNKSHGRSIAKQQQPRRKITREKLSDKLIALLTTDMDGTIEPISSLGNDAGGSGAFATLDDVSDDHKNNKNCEGAKVSSVVAYAVPTFQAPQFYFHSRPLVRNMGIFFPFLLACLPARQQQRLLSLTAEAENSQPLFKRQQKLRSDTETMQDILWEAVKQQQEGVQPMNNALYTVRMAAAYLNLTDALATTLSNYNRLPATARAPDDAAAVHMLTAGSVSHGFKPKECPQVSSPDSNKRFIPALYDRMARCTMAANQHNSKLWFYQRPGWTFHAKGMWLTVKNEKGDHHHQLHTNNKKNGNKPRLSSSQQYEELLESLAPASIATNNTSPSVAVEEEETLVVVTYGSGNFGARSAFRDMESNLWLILPSSSPSSNNTFVKQQVDGWNCMCQYAAPADQEPVQQTSLLWRYLFPLTKHFF